MAFGPLLGYADTFEKVQFVWDLVHWTEIGAKRNMSKAPLRIMMAGHSMSPEYWHAVKFALVDMVRQMGFPLAMITQSMREEMMPYPHWVCDAMEKACRSRTNLPVAETLATTHSLVQTIKGAVLGLTAPRDKWQSHLLSPFDSKSFGAFLRIEYQDGTRKAATQDYHGSGRPHTHTILFGDPEAFARLPLPNVLAASPVEDPVVEGYCQAVQFDTYTRKSGWPRRDGPSEWAADGTLRLHHDSESHRLGRRACLPAVMEAMPLHQDIVVTDDRAGLMRAYMAKYGAKFSGSLMADLLGDDGSAVHVAMALVDRYHPAEPEMIMQLCAQKIRLWSLSTLSGGKRNFLAPAPDAEWWCVEVTLYMAAPWARGQISLLDFLRKTGSQGQILQWLRKEHVQAGSPGDLEAFARGFTVTGQKVVAARTLSWFNDRFFGQWLMLHVPFNDPSDFVNEDTLAKVPKQFRYFAMAITCESAAARATWQNEDAIHMELKVEGHSVRHATSVLDMCRANASLVREYLDGTLDIADEEAHRREREAAQREQFLGGVSSERQREQIRDLFSVPAQARRELRLPIYPEHEEAISRGAKDVEGRIDKGVAADVRAGDVLVFGRARRQVLAAHRFGGFRDMLEELGFERAVPDAANVSQALRVYHGFRNYARLAREHGVVAFELGELPAAEGVIDDRAFPWTPQQRQVNSRLDEFLDLAIDAANDPDEDRAMVAVDRLWHENRIVAVLGPPGSGKTTVQKRLILRNHAKGGRGFYALPNNALSTRMRDLCGSIIQTGTCHSILGLDEHELYWPSLQFWQLGLIDEISQLQGYHFQQIAKMFQRAERRLVLLLAGDKWQMSGVGEDRVWHTNAWRDTSLTFKVEFPQMHRCKDENFARILNELRTNYPSGDTLSALRAPALVAWYPIGPPTPEGMRKLLRQHPETHVLVVSRVGAETVNGAALQAKFPHYPPRAWVPGDVESFSENYNNGALKPAAELRPSQFPVFKGMKAFITKTLRKDLDYVNGMEVTVQGWSQPNRAIRVVTKTGRTFDITRWADPDMDHLAYYPLRVGYASTILRMAGAELQHVTVYLDVPHVSAAAYTALSRVATLKQVKLGGKLTRDHFAPARP